MMKDIDDDELIIAQIREAVKKRKENQGAAPSSKKHNIFAPPKPFAVPKKAKAAAVTSQTL